MPSSDTTVLRPTTSALWRVPASIVEAIDAFAAAAPQFEKKPLPRWGGKVEEIDFQNIFYYLKPTENSAEKSWDDVPAYIKETFDKLGIPEDEQRAIFEEFRRLDQPSPWGEKGLGLGLSIVERIGKVAPESVLPPLTDAAWGYRRKGRFSVRRVEKKDKTVNEPVQFLTSRARRCRLALRSRCRGSASRSTTSWVRASRSGAP